MKKTTSKATKTKMAKDVHVIPLSKTVSYQYIEQKGRKTQEGLLANARWYPGARVKGRFYYGLRQEKRFIPGIVWCQRFIPGVVSRRGFLPGLVNSAGFTPGVIAAGAFVPGVVRGNFFVPGIVSERRFLPGAFTNTRQFVPGRFMRGRFENGVLEDTHFIPLPCEKMAPRTAHALLQDGYGIGKIRRFEALGGVAHWGHGDRLAGRHNDLYASRSVDHSGPHLGRTMEQGRFARHRYYRRIGGDGL